MGSYNREFIPWSFIRSAFVRMPCLTFSWVDWFGFSNAEFLGMSLACGGV